MLLNEIIYNTTYSLNWTENDVYVTASCKTPNNDKILTTFSFDDDSTEETGKNYWILEFEVNGRIEKQSKELIIKYVPMIISIVSQSVKTFIHKHRPDIIGFGAEGDSKQKLYNRLIKVLGYPYNVTKDGKMYWYEITIS